MPRYSDNACLHAYMSTDRVNFTFFIFLDYTFEFRPRAKKFLGVNSRDLINCINYSTGLRPHGDSDNQQAIQLFDLPTPTAT